MSSSDINFISGSSRSSQDKPELNFSLCHAYPTIDDDRETSAVLTKSKRNSSTVTNKNVLAEDGLYVSENPFTDKLIKPYYRLGNVKSLHYESRSRFRGRLVEIAVREIRIRDEEEDEETREGGSRAAIEITSVSILYGRKLICRTNSPFNRKLHKLLIRDPECVHSLSIQVHARHGESSVLPLPLPRRCVRDRQVDIDFAIETSSGAHAGTAICTVSVSAHGADEVDEADSNARVYRPSNDPNDPQNSLFLLRPEKSRAARKEDVTYFTLEDPDLLFNTDVSVVPRGKSRRESGVSKSPDIVVTEQPVFSLLNVSLRSIFQASRPLRPTSGARRPHAVGKTVLAVTVLRGVEVPVREESALVSPLLEVQWGGVVRATSVADGPAPVWQQTMHFELPRQNGEHCVRFRLYDQHPVWGQQWLGEARIPLERHRNYQELERWVALSPLLSPVLLLGYVQASPGQSHTRIYVLVKMEQPGNANSVEAGAIDALSKGIQRCLAVPYKVAGVETPDYAARLAMLLASLPVHYGPVTPRQALNMSKVDHYGRAALLATLLQGFGLQQSYVLLGSSQTSRWAAFVLSIEENDVVLWDPEIGDHYKLSDSRCSLMRVSRLISHLGIWENTQRSVLPHNLKYNVTLGKDWRPLAPVAASTGSRSVQTLELANNVADEDAPESAEMEQYLRDKLAGWRGALGLTTIFNRHAVGVIRGFLSGIPRETGRHFQLDRRDLKQLYRAYHTHGFILNLRQTAVDELAEQLAATKVKDVTGPIEFALVCHVQRYVGKTRSIWLALAILRSRG